MGNQILRSYTDVQQGDPLVPLLFDLALHKPIQSLRARLKKFQDSTDSHLLSFYLDDGVLIFRHAVLREALPFLQSDYVKGFGLLLDPSKCQVLWPTDPVTSGKACNQNMFRQTYGAGTDVLKAGIESDKLVRRAIIDQANNAQDLLALISTIKDAHVALYFLRSYTETCRMIYLFSTVHTHLFLEGQRFLTTTSSHVRVKSLAVFCRRTSCAN